MSEGLRLIVYSVDGSNTQETDIESLNVRLIDGSLIGIRPGHDRLIAMTDGNELFFQRNGETIELDAEAGLLAVEKNVVKIFTTM